MNISYNDFITLKKKYNKAVSEGKDIFIFKGQELLVAYAEYLIQYLSTQFDISSLN